MHTVEFIPAHWLEQSAFAVSSGLPLVCYSRPISVERRQVVRRAEDRTEQLIRSLLSE